MAAEGRRGIADDAGWSFKARGAAAEPGAGLTLALFAAFVAVWSAYFAISQAPASVHNDMAEAYVWGQEFQLGYNQHPPFWAWICGVWFSVFPRAGWAFAILGSLNAGIGLLGAWRLIGRFAEGEKRSAATLLLLLTPFYTFLAYKYNANSIFLSIWPWTLYFFLRSVDGRGLLDAVLFGLCMGLALLSKYYALILAATCLIAALQHPLRQRYFASASPYVSAGVAAALCAPHLWWLLSSGAPPLRYLSRISGRGFDDVAFHAATAFFGALAQNALVFAVVAIVARPRPSEAAATIPAQWTNPRFRLLTILATAPLILTVLAGLALRTKVSTNMLIGTFSLMPLLAIEIAGARRLMRLRAAAAGLAAALSLGALVASPAVALARAWYSHDADDVQPRKELAAAATSLWREKTGRPLAYVGGTHLYENGVAFYSPDRPHGFVHFDFFRNRWVTPQALAENGLLSVCVKDDADCLAATAALATPQATQTDMTLAHDFWGHKGKPVSFVVTIIPPRGG
ncbi:MAG: glycosyltransferase family 39 protein [Roseiarcus sp.]|jgi:4-amino-4-deoxy-L-arabinose transferase-like glycosyltransferase